MYTDFSRSIQVDAVINTGVAGSLRNEINIADIVLSTDALQHDMDATDLVTKQVSSLEWRRLSSC